MFKHIASVFLVGTTVACQARRSLDSTSLDVSADVKPSCVLAFAGTDSSAALVTIAARNPTHHRVVVHLGGPPYKSGAIPAAETQGIGFGLRILPADGASRRGPTRWTWGQPDFIFEPRQTISHSFPIYVTLLESNRDALTPGAYRIVASFGHKEATPVSLRVER